jgi:hypothetical protein
MLDRFYVKLGRSGAIEFHEGVETMSLGDEKAAAINAPGAAV